METLKQYLYQEVISKAKYNKLFSKKIIHPEDYLFLDLNKEQLKLLESLCQEYDIILEILPPKISNEETKNLLSYYYELKRIAKDNKNNQLNDTIIEVRDTIFNGNIELVYKFITKFYKPIINIQDKEDIYQTGYEILLRAIDEYQENNNHTFLVYLINLIYTTINEKYCIKHTKENADNDIELPKETIPKYIPDYYHTEEYLIDLITSEEIKKVVLTLPKLEQKVLTLTYGLDGKGIRNIIDTANELGISKQSVIFNKNRALISLSLPPRRDYLKSIYLERDFFHTTSTYEEIEEIKSRTDIQTLDINKKNTIDFLIRSIPKSELVYLIQKLPKKFQDIFSLYYGLPDGLSYSKEEISVKLGVSQSQVLIKLSKGLELFQKILKTAYYNKYYRCIDKDYLELIMYEYLTGHKAKCKSRVKIK